jgi:hypothetical protein
MLAVGFALFVIDPLPSDRGSPLVGARVFNQQQSRRSGSLSGSITSMWLWKTRSKRFEHQRRDRRLAMRNQSWQPPREDHDCPDDNQRNMIGDQGKDRVMLQPKPDPFCLCASSSERM